MKTWTLKIEACGSSQEEAANQAKKLLEMMLNGKRPCGYTTGNVKGNASGNWEEIDFSMREINVAKTGPKPTVEELERILASGEPLDIEIQPDGSIRSVPKGTAVNADVKPVTHKQAVAEYY